MGSVARDARPGSRSWVVRWRDPNGAQRSRSFPRKVDADRFLASTTHGLHSGSYVDPAGGRTTFAEYAETWRTGQVHRASSAAHVETMLRRHAYPAFGSRTLSSIRPSEVQAWVRRLSTGSDDRAALAPSTVGVAHGLVAAVFKAAIRDRLLSASPCEGVKLPKTEPRKVEPLSTHTVHRLADAVPARYRALVMLAAGTGLRQGEAFGVTLDRVDFLRRTLTVDRQMVQLVGQPPTFGPPKTRASHRTVPLPQVVVEELAEHLRAFPAGRDGLIFTTVKGEPIRRTGFSAVWRPAVRRADVEDVTFHALRHYYASLLIRHGESVKVVQTRLGHATAAETLDTYSHLWPDAEDQTRAAVDAVLGADSTRCATGVRQSDGAGA